ncbi:hypothetical protein [Achromobacter kerstersii]
MYSHYQTLKDAELLLKKFGVRDNPRGNRPGRSCVRHRGMTVCGFKEIHGKRYYQQR